jgi:mono/diheme cytochrome c family protein
VFAILPDSNGCLPSSGSEPQFITQEKNSMSQIYRWLLCAVVFLAAGSTASRLFSWERPTPGSQKVSNSPAQEGSIERGRYLVENVAMCEECHTPRDNNGNLDESRRLQGAAIWIVPVHPMTNWANRAPALAGFEQFTEEQGEQILEKGIGPNGLQLQPPMHIYHMTHADAQAVIAYLRSLSGAYPQAQ